MRWWLQPRRPQEVDDGLAIHPGVEGVAASYQPADGRVVAFAVAPSCQLLDDGLDFRGARSGRNYSFPDGYAEDAEGLVMFTRFAWWKNFREGRPVSLCLRGREVRGWAVAVRDPEQVAERFAYYLQCNPHDGRYFGVRVGRDGRVDPDDLACAAARLVMVRTLLGKAPRVT